MNNDIKEEWIDLPRTQNQANTMIAVSNLGRYRRLNGEVGILSKTKFVIRGEELLICSHIIAEHFLITVRRPDQRWVDHIQHHPTEYNVNDVRNLRWCTQGENNGFAEANENRSRSQIGTFTGDKNANWKGDDALPPAKYIRARKLYKAGIISESELHEYAVAKQQYRKEHSKK